MLFWISILISAYACFMWILVGIFMIPGSGHSNPPEQWPMALALSGTPVSLVTSFVMLLNGKFKSSKFFSIITIIASLITYAVIFYQLH